MEIKCSCCDAASDLDSAANDGEWIPCFWDELTMKEFGPTCPDCVARLSILTDPNGEYFCLEVV